MGTQGGREASVHDVEMWVLGLLTNWMWEDRE